MALNKKTLLTAVGSLTLLFGMCISQLAFAWNLTDSNCPTSGHYETGILKGISCKTPPGYTDPSASSTPDAKAIVLNAFRNLVNTVLLPITGTIFTIVMIAGGLMYITSGGNPQRIESAKKFLTAGIVGLGIIILAYFLITVFVSLLGGTIS
jgi:hypothetical protein